jgi:hypothetical protein
MDVFWMYTIIVLSTQVRCLDRLCACACVLEVRDAVKLDVVFLPPTSTLIMGRSAKVHKRVVREHERSVA